MHLTPFNQNAMLSRLQDPDARRGACAALADMWLTLMEDATARSPEERMDSLRSTISFAIRRQAEYRDAFRRRGRDAARRELDERFGFGVEEQTRIERRFTGRAGMVMRMREDLELPGARASWSLIWPGGAHAIAGVHNASRVTTNVMRVSLHLFDPNLGEYVGQLHEVPAIVDDMFQRVRPYSRIETMERRFVDAPEADEEDRFKLS